VVIASGTDVVAVTGYGWPNERVGPWPSTAGGM